MLLRNTFFTLFVACSPLAGSSCFAMDVEQNTASISVLQKQQIEAIKDFVVERQSKNLPVIMVLGAKNTECNRITGDEYIFFDCLSHDPQGRPHIQGNFNDDNLLTALAVAINSSLDQLVVDSSTTKDARWEPKHISLFVKMLKPEGKFLIPPTYDGGAITERFSTREQMWLKVTQENQEAFSSPYLRWGICYALGYSFTDVVSEDLKEPEFKATVEKELQRHKFLQPFTHLDEEEFEQKAEELGFTHLLYSKNTVADDQKLQFSIAKNIKADEVFDKTITEIYHPYVKAFLAPYFKEVIVDYEEPFPFRTTHPIRRVICAQYPQKI